MRLVRFSRWLAHHKCLITQGAQYVQMCIIFFVGSISIQSWLERHYSWSPNIAIPFVLAILGAWVIGNILWDIGVIGEEQRWYTDNNEVFVKLAKENTEDSK